jgi:hypothetical protein
MDFINSYEDVSRADACAMVGADKATVEALTTGSR